MGPTSRRPVEFGTDPLSQLSGSSSDSEAPDIQSSESRNSLVARSRSDPTGQATTITPSRPSSPLQRLTQSIRGKTPLQQAASKALANLISNKPNFINFNKIADELKEHPNYENELLSQFGSLNEKQINKIASMSEYDLRGFDREVMEKVLIITKLKLQECGNIKKAEQLDSRIKNLQTTKIISVTPEKMQKLGGGAVNVVYKVTYKKNDSTLKAVFKPDPADLDPLTQFREQHFGTAAASGIPPGVDAHLPARAVASSVVDGLLYGDDRISVKTQYAIVNGQRGILMEKATGSSPKVTKTEEREIDPEDKTVVFKFIHEQMKADPKFLLNPVNRQQIAILLKCRSVKIELDDNMKLKFFGTFAEIQHLEPENATTAEGLVRLQVKDYITGECDRHPENYFIDADGNVKGIDEDCCFGVNAVPEGVDVRGQESLKGIIPNNASLMLRMPPVVTEKIRDEIADLAGKIDELRESLEQYISPEEIAATLQRLTTLHAHVTSENCLVVQNAEGLLTDVAQHRIDTNNSYWARELVVYAEDKNGWNYLREHRTM